MASKPILIQRLADRQSVVLESYLAKARNSGIAVSLDSSAWAIDTVLAPNVSDKETVLALARAAADSYHEVSDEAGWRDVGPGFNLSQSFGWQKDGLRGHIFADEGNSTILMSLKGTSVAVFDGEGTTTPDKVNDNLFFSCCCGQGHYLWRQVCDCYSTTYTCNQACLVKALKKENRYYRAALELYSNVTEIYPHAEIWLTGHSLGGAVSSFLGMTFGNPTVTFEAPGEALAASRLGLPKPPNSRRNIAGAQSERGIYHFGHTADPIFMGTCNGAVAGCTLGGYAMETQCHSGLQCVYDTVTDFGWSVGLLNHKIDNVIDTVLEKYDSPPSCVPDNECVDCYNWKYFDGNVSDPSSEPTMSASTRTSISRTRTATCHTPGWWGCLDKTTTAESTSSMASSSTTSTCETPGWFWCNDPTTTTATSTYTSSVLPASTASFNPCSTTAPSATCRHPGWSGCRDSTSVSYLQIAPKLLQEPFFHELGHSDDLSDLEIGNTITSTASLPTLEFSTA